MYHHILVPLDGSTMSESILDHVINLAQNDKAEVTLLRVGDPPILLGRDEVIDTTSYKKSRNKMKKRIETYLISHMDKLKKNGIKADYKIGHGSIIPTILETAKDEKADLIAMTTHGFDRLSHSIYGSIAAGLLQKSHCPMLITRSNAGG